MSLFTNSWIFSLHNSPCKSLNVQHLEGDWLEEAYNTDTVCVCARVRPCISWGSRILGGVEGWRNTQIRTTAAHGPCKDKNFNTTYSLSHMQCVPKEVTTAASIWATFTELNLSSLLTRVQPHIPPPFSFSISRVSPSTFPHTTAGRISLWLSGVEVLRVCMFNILGLQESSLK